MSIGAAFQVAANAKMQEALENEDPSLLIEGMRDSILNPGSSRIGEYDFLGTPLGETEGKTCIIPNAEGWISLVRYHPSNQRLVDAFNWICTITIFKIIPDKENPCMWGSISCKFANAVRSSGERQICKIHELKFSKRAGLCVQVIFPEEPYVTMKEAEEDNLVIDSPDTIYKTPSLETFRKWNPDLEVTVTLNVNLFDTDEITDPFVKAVYEFVNYEISGLEVFEKIRELPGVTLNWGKVKPDV